MRKVLISLGIAVFILVGAGLFMARFFTNGGRHSGSYSHVASREEAASLDAAALAGAGPAASAPGKAAEEEAGAVAAEGAMLHGRVTDEADRGLEGAMVYVQRAEDFRRGGGDPARLFRDRFLGKEDGPRSGVAASQRTSADGSYSIPLSALRPGTYEVVARHREFAARAEEWTWTPEASELNFQLPFGDAITGIVLDVEGHPVAGAAVEAYAEDEGWRGGFGRAFTDRDETEADGKFHLGVPSGTFRLAGKAKTFAAAEVRSVASGTQDIEIVLAPAPGVIGRVVDEEERPVVAAIVQLVARQDWGGRGGRGGRDGPGGDGRGGDGPPARILRVFRGSDAKVETDADGRFRASDLSLGSYFVFAEKQGFVPSQSEVDLSREEKEASTSLTLRPGKVISGTVKDAEGNAVPGAFVVVGEDRNRDENDRNDRRERGPRGGRNGRDGERGEGEAAPEDAPPTPEEPRPPEAISPFRALTATESDGGGKFIFDTLPSGRYSLSVQAEDFVAWRQDGIELDPPVKLDVVLDPGIALEGKVVSSAGDEPVAGARIVLRREDDERREVKTDEEGRYRFHGLFPGRSMRVDLSAKGFTASTVEEFEIAASPTTQTRDFKLEAAASVSGRITSTKGEPVFNARVSVVPVVEEEADGGNGFRGRRRSWTRSASGRTDPEGEFSLADVNSGPAFRVEVQHPDYKAFRSETFAIQPGAQLQGLVYALQAGGRLEVLVRDPNGTATPGARVRIALQQTEEEVAAAAEATATAGGGGPEGRRGGGGFGGRGGFDPRRFDPSRNATRSSGPDGRAVFSGIKGGTYTVSATVTGFQPFSSQVAVMEDQLTPFTLDLLPENVISGTVTDGAGEPVAEVRLEAMRELEDGRREGSEARSDEKGAFRIGSLGAGPYRLRARQRGFSEAELRDVEVNHEVTVVLERLGGISGWVLAAETGAAVQEFAVRLRPERGSRQESGEEGDGAASGFGGGFRGVDGGGGPGGGGPEGRGGGGRFGGGPEGFGGRGGGPGGVGGFGGRGGGPGGFGGFGGGPGGRRGFGREGRSFNDPAGLFTLEEVRPGAYILQVTADGYTGAEVRVKVEEGKVTEGVEARLLQGLAAVGVVQAKGDMTPVAGAEVYLLPLQPREEEAEPVDPDARREERRAERERRREERRNGGGRADPQAALARLAGGVLQSAMMRGDAASRTDESGGFQIKDVNAGEYLLIVNHPDFVPALVETDFGLDGGARALRVILDSGEELTGAIELPQGNAAAGATVTLRDTNGVTKRTTADGAGRYRFAGLVPGSYTLSVRAPESGRTAPVTVEIRAGTNRFDHRLQAAGAATAGSR